MSMRTDDPRLVLATNPPQCSACSYELPASGAGVCPECGHAYNIQTKRGVKLALPSELNEFGFLWKWFVLGAWSILAWILLANAMHIGGRYVLGRWPGPMDYQPAYPTWIFAWNIHRYGMFVLSVANILSWPYLLLGIVMNRLHLRRLGVRGPWINARALAWWLCAASAIVLLVYFDPINAVDWWLD